MFKYHAAHDTFKLEAKGRMAVVIRMSSMRGFPIILQNRQEGLLQCISLDPAQKRVHALVISCGIRGKKIVFATHVRSIADGFILVDSIEKYSRHYETNTCRFVRDTTGLLAGSITDYAIDERTLSIQALEMIPGYLPSERRIRIWVYEYVRADEKSAELVVPASLGRELILSGEGNVYENIHYERNGSRRNAGDFYWSRTDDDAAGKANEAGSDEKRTSIGQADG